MKTIAKIGFVLAVSLITSLTFGQEPPAKLTKEKPIRSAQSGNTLKKKPVVRQSIPAKKLEAKPVKPAR